MCCRGWPGNIWRATLSVSVLIAISAAGASAADPPIIVRERHLACVIERAAIYLSAERNPQLISLADCAKGSAAPADFASGIVNTLPAPWTDGGVKVSD